MSDLDATRRLLREMPFKDEAEVLRGLLSRVRLSREERQAITQEAAEVVERLRRDASAGLMEKFLAEYGLGTEEGVALMCLAEAFLRTPDAPSLDLLIADKIGTGNWQRHLGRAESSLINASTWALMLTGRVFRRKNKDAADLGEVMRGVVRRLGEPIARAAVGEAMKVLGRQFVLGRTIEEALERGSADWKRGLSHSFDMLGEAAKTAKDAYRYFLSYSAAITAIAKHARDDDPMANPGISVKLSALHPRYETLQRDRVMAELVPRVAALAEQARAANIGFNIDAEEADRLDLSFDVVEAVLRSQSLKGWGGFGVVIQAYAKTASPAIDWVYGLAKKLDRQMAVRLVKGAYWDAEIKLAQVLGLATYPVFTRKASTDLSYLVCARQLLEANDRIYPQFATHNAHTVAAIQQIAGKDARFEFQRLHGMGEALHDVMREIDGRRRRIYAPVGVHQDLLAYLVRRLLENGANSSFVHQLLDKAVPAEEIARDPVANLEGAGSLAHDKIPLPAQIFGKGRRNSSGVNLNQPALGEAVAEEMRPFRESRWRAGPGVGEGSPPRPVVSPINGRDQVGEVSDATPGAVHEALSVATGFAATWGAVTVAERAAMLERAADLYEKHRGELMALATREAGKTRLDGIAEVREAVDFLRYYAAEARSTLNGRAPLGPIVCISPWNFPLAIFTGQIAAALVAGNPVIAKPAEQTPLIAARAVELLHQAGIAKEALILLPGDGASVGAALTSDPRVKGVCFTGGTDTAQLIDRALAEKGDPSAVLIAETGGLNAMIVDSTALAEQAVRDIVASAFQSAGQRCSALRVLYLQEDVAPRVLEMLEGAASELVIGDPWQPATDVGPVIDREAEATILAHCEKMEGEGRLLFKLRKPDTCPEGTFVSPAAYRLEKIGQLSREIFGPILHVVTYKSEDLDHVVDQINATGYGLTLGVHSRIDQRVDRVCDRARVGNIYVNRNQIGAVVGSQPFGGEGLSGTGPKAGGPNYLTRFTKPLGQGKPDFKAVPLPGPTGESNLYKLSPRGAVLCAGPSAEDRKRQATLASSLGNKVLADGDVLKLAAEAEIDAVLYDGPDRAALRRILAKRQGARVPLLSSSDDPIRLCVEQVVSEDTTAAGGNASLLAATA